MKTTHIAGLMVFALFFSLGLFTQRGSAPAGGELEQASRDPAQAAGRVFAVGAFLPEAPNQKIYLIINGRNIQAMGPQRPGNLPVFETDALVFPGLMDMHNHMKYNVLPLWGLAKGQFLNRFEWRKRSPQYKDATSFNMKALTGDGVCAAVRWAELKALFGGATSIQGIGADSKCASFFGVMNVEIPGELSPAKIRATTDIVTPEFLSVYAPTIQPQIRGSFTEGFTEAAEVQQRRAYDAALMNVLVRTGALAWMDEFANSPRSIHLGLKLTIGLIVPPQPDLSPATFERMMPLAHQHLVNVHKLKPEAANKQIANLRLWFYGKDGRTGYLALPRPNQPIKDFALIDDSRTMDYFGKAGVLTLDPKVRRYLAMFEVPGRRSLLKYFDSPERQAVIAHLAEGQRNDPYNRSEYGYAREMGFLRPGLVMIHAVGLDSAQLADAARRKLSIVWSPFSNLLLYGETLDIVTAKKVGLNITLGPDWTPTGSKNMLDELKIARRYLNKIGVPLNVISDKDLVDMATINAARALGLDRVVGRVAPGFTANLLFIDKGLLAKMPDPYMALVNAGQEHVQLVTVGGEPLYGSLPLIQSISQTFHDIAPPEAVPRDTAKCGYQKGFRMPWYAPYDRDLQARGMNLRTVATLENELRGKFSAYAQWVRANQPAKVSTLAWLDPLFSCEDDYYRSAFGSFIEKTMDQNLRERPALRRQLRLDDKWSPMKDSSAEDDAVE